MKGSNFVFDRIDEIRHKYHRISLNCGGSYIDSPDWTKK